MRADTKNRKKATEALRGMTDEEWWTDRVFQVMTDGKRALDATLHDIGRMVAEAVMYMERTEATGPDYLCLLNTHPPVGSSLADSGTEVALINGAFAAMLEATDHSLERCSRAAAGQGRVLLSQGSPHAGGNRKLRRDPRAQAASCHSYR